MGYKVMATLAKDGKEYELLVAQYGGAIVQAGRRAFDKVQKLLAQPDHNGSHIVSAKVVRSNQLGGDVALPPSP